MKDTFTIAEIKQAFWKSFHQAGELWFPYPVQGSGDSTVGEEATRSAFREFWEHLLGSEPSDEEWNGIFPVRPK